MKQTKEFLWPKGKKSGDKDSILSAGCQSNLQPHSSNSSAGSTGHCVSHSFQTLLEGRSPLEGSLSTQSPQPHSKLIASES